MTNNGKISICKILYRNTYIDKIWYVDKTECAELLFVNNHKINALTSAYYTLYHW